MPANPTSPRLHATQQRAREALAVIPRPLEGHYVPTLISALTALIPYLLVTTGADLYRDPVMMALHATPSGMQLASAISAAGYAFGAFLAGDLINRIGQRPLFSSALILEAAGWILMALAPSVLAYAIGLLLAGFATGLLIVVALPPVMRQFPPRLAPITAGFVNLGLFGAVAAGPLLGGFIGAVTNWRALYGALAAVSLANLALAAVSMPDNEPFKPELRFDAQALVLAGAATLLPFLAAGALASKSFTAPVVFIPLTIGLIALVVLLVYQYSADEPLAPVKMMCTTLPIIGTIAATFGGAVVVSLMRLISAELLQVSHLHPGEAGLAFWPEALGTLVTASLYIVVLRTRYVSLLVLAGLLLLCCAAGLLVTPGALQSPARLGGALALLGAGAGATVGPGLFMAGLALPSTSLGRVFALIELVRSVGDFLLGPVLVHVAKSAGGGKPTTPSVHLSVASALAIAAVATLACAALELAGGGKRRAPDFAAWIGRSEPALPSPRLLARVASAP